MEQGSFTLGQQAGLLWTWWREDSLPALPLLADLVIEQSVDSAALAGLMATTEEAVMSMLGAGHRAYLAYMGALPVAVGWSAGGRAEFGGGLVKFEVPIGNRYLYYFITLPAWRGQGIYPRLLQHILRCEEENERFWIVHQHENVASQRGIEKAGFQIASKVYFIAADKLALVPPSVEASERARAGSALFGLPLCVNS
ncbi:GNAT family N-acetyltransferase [Dictyobacter aurantiacus]|uniref:N-acetyltransferase domain-containing protein n=1 Tax=Dictyobacter aurantiacus TaxID=1936993 RepID=A0A401ZMR5_9CHLR|nr:GNAT family N-acetyltransferase [Dictyobacter aurantiacus]GCE08056.1 hypothetical protein KDAU_53850 [Dictyobacter aurantiacus]